MADLVVGTVIVVIIGSAIRYLIKEKKNGSPCVGCPSGSACAAKSKGTSCGCGK